ncbi:MAG: NYN domain-containing protein [Clostridiales bacterium]|jgi:uncharacterized protein (TIGR00288 family)|nr:NYN domain-containing protein [Clostridiales bacterium]
MLNDKTSFAVFVDLENTGGKVTMLNNIIEKVKIRGNILIGKVYGYTDSYAPLRELLLSNTFSAIPSIRYGPVQKNSLDIQLVIDALEIAYSNTLIDSFCIVSGDSDYTPLVGKLKSMGKFVLGISRSECASNIFINACNEFTFLESVTKSAGAKPKSKQQQAAAKQPAKKAPGALGAADAAADGDEQNGAAYGFGFGFGDGISGDGDGADELNSQIVTILDEQSDSDGYIFASELKNILLRLRPDFNERNYGQPSFGKLLDQLERKFGDIHTEADNYALKVRLSALDEDGSPAAALTKDNWTGVFAEALKRFKDEGFERVNPSILKAAISGKYPNFEEKQIGFKKFSDLLKSLAKSGYLTVEYSDSREMLVRIL